MSCGLRGPSINGSPARTCSPSCTFTWTPRGRAYSRSTPFSLMTWILRWPFEISPYLTIPSISVMTAVSRGLRASNNSTTRGRPPVMSLVVVVDLELRAVHDRVALFLAAFLVHDREHAVTVHRNEEAFLVSHGLQLMELDRAGVLRFQTGLFGHAARRTADVERTHRKLRS